MSSSATEAAHHWEGKWPGPFSKWNPAGKPHLCTTKKQNEVSAKVSNTSACLRRGSSPVRSCGMVFSSEPSHSGREKSHCFCCKFSYNYVGNGTNLSSPYIPPPVLCPPVRAVKWQERASSTLQNTRLKRKRGGRGKNILHKIYAFDLFVAGIKNPQKEIQ